MAKLGTVFKSPSAWQRYALKTRLMRDHIDGHALQYWPVFRSPRRQLSRTRQCCMDVHFTDRQSKAGRCSTHPYKTHPAATIVITPSIAAPPSQPSQPPGNQTSVFRYRTSVPGLFPRPPGCPADSNHTTVVLVRKRTLQNQYFINKTYFQI